MSKIGSISFSTQYEISKILSKRKRKGVKITPKINPLIEKAKKRIYYEQIK